MAANDSTADASEKVADDDDDNDIAPRPRPGFRSRRDALGGAEKAHLVAGVLRAAVGCAGLFAALLYLPIQAVTPVLAGVSILMMVTGCTSAVRAVREIPALSRVPLFVVGACALVTLVTIILTATVGAGSLGPLSPTANAKRAAAAADDGHTTVSFQPTP